MAATKDSYKWSPAQVNALIASYQTDGPKKLSEDLGIPYWILLSKAKRLGIAATRKRPPKGFEWTEAMIKQIKLRYVEEGGDELAKEFGIGLGTVQRKAAALGLHTNAGHKRWGRQRAAQSITCDPTYFDEWSPNMAYVLGFLFADGSIDKSLHGVRVNVIATDRAALDFIRSELKAWRYQVRIKPGKGRDKAGARLAICNSIITQKLVARGMKPRKTYNDDPFPDVPDRFMADFIRGYLDGDGYVAKGKKYPGCGIGFVGSVKFISGIHDNLIRLTGISKRLVKVMRGKTADWATVTWGAFDDLSSLRDFIYYPGHGFCLERKKTKLFQWFAEKHRPRQKYRWTSEEERQVKEYYTTRGTYFLSKLLGKPRATIASKAKQLGCDPVSLETREKLRIESRRRRCPDGYRYNRGK